MNKELQFFSLINFLNSLTCIVNNCYIDTQNYFMYHLVTHTRSLLLPMTSGHLITELCRFLRLTYLSKIKRTSIYKPGPEIMKTLFSLNSTKHGISTHNDKYLLDKNSQLNMKHISHSICCILYHIYYCNV